MKIGKIKTSIEPQQSDSAERVKLHRASLRARGMRLVSRKPEFIRQYRKHLAVLRENPERPAFWKWMDQMQDTEGWV
ncbi:MAG: DUF3018 family protein [Acidobacteria bacterium]|nr:DUF3018 family protein [Acidobacteriota bacterium]